MSAEDSDPDEFYDALEVEVGINADGEHAVATEEGESHC